MSSEIIAEKNRNNKIFIVNMYIRIGISTIFFILFSTLSGMNALEHSANIWAQRWAVKDTWLDRDVEFSLSC